MLCTQRVQYKTVVGNKSVGGIFSWKLIKSMHVVPNKSVGKKFSWKCYGKIPTKTSVSQELPLTKKWIKNSPSNS